MLEEHIKYSPWPRDLHVTQRAMDETLKRANNAHFVDTFHVPGKSCTIHPDTHYAVSILSGICLGIQTRSSGPCYRSVGLWICCTKHSYRCQTGHSNLLGDMPGLEMLVLHMTCWIGVVWGRGRALCLLTEEVRSESNRFWDTIPQTYFRAAQRFDGESGVCLRRDVCSLSRRTGCAVERTLARTSSVVHGVQTPPLVQGCRRSSPPALCV